MNKLFGTDGVRGVANTELTNEITYKLGKFGAHVITQKKNDDTNNNAKIIIGKDTRVSGDMLESALISGILAAGCDVIKVGVVPTPAIAYLIKHLEVDAGVMISASHNPVEFNGIKFFNNKGLKLSKAVENEIEDYILNNKELEHVPSGTEIGRKTRIFKGINLYSDFIKNSITSSFEGLKIAVDCANGAASEVAPLALKNLGAEVIAIHNTPTGYNINDQCGSTHPEELRKLVKKENADIGLAFDGDADRLIAVDEKGEIVDGDMIMAICGNHLNQKGKLNKGTIVSTVMSNIGFDIALKNNNLKSVKTQVGDKYVLEEMIKNNYSLGGEQSGHIIYLDYNTTGDGLLSGVQLINVMVEQKKKLSELKQIMTKYPQILKNAKVSNKTKHNFDKDPVIIEEIKKVEDHFHGEGRVLVRASGTEPLVRVMIEGKEKSKLEKYSQELVTLIEKQLN